MSTTYLITGASRGLGLELVRQILEANVDYKVIAAARDLSTAQVLQCLAVENAGRVFVIRLDVTDPKSVKAAVDELKSSGSLKDGLDVLINNAGVFYGGFNTIAQSQAQ